MAEALCCHWLDTVKVRPPSLPPSLLLVVLVRSGSTCAAHSC